MIGVNLHHVVRGIITALHPDEGCLLYQAVGQDNDKGLTKARYRPAVAVKASIQPLDSQALNHLERAGDTKASEQAFLYSDLGLPVSGIDRAGLRPGDMLQRQDGGWWLITSVLEDWSWDGWANVAVVRQLEPPVLAGGGGD